MPFLKKQFSSFVIWFLAACLFGLIRIYGNEELPAFERTLAFSWIRFFLEMLVLGITVSIPFGILDFLFERTWFKKQSYWIIITLQTFIQVMIGILSLACLALFAKLFFKEIFADEVFINPLKFIQTNTGVLWIFYITGINLNIYILKVLKTKIGSRVFTNLLLGKYHSPREESRIFMFLDMKDSTVFGEKLGHIKFSALIQDCFKDLTRSIIEHHVEVYQYVGDEAVMTWKIKSGLHNQNCIAAYYSFIQSLGEREEYYKSCYETVPKFKAGVHIGKVTVAEVGVMKREIAYHSDVLNTTSRIQSKCNELKASLLISQDLKEELPQHGKYTFSLIENIALKGKANSVNIWKVEKH